MKTNLMVITGIVVLLGIALIPAASAQAAYGNEDAVWNVADNPVQLDCDGQAKGEQRGPRDGTKGDNAPRDGRGARRGEGRGARDGSGQGRGEGRGGGQGQGPRDGTGPGCNNQ